MCPVRSVTYVSGRSKAVSQFPRFCSPSLAHFSIHELRSNTHRIEHCALSREPIRAHALRVQLKRCVHVAVPEQALKHFRVCADAEEESGQRVPQIVEAKPAFRRQP
jgi:hypothetical protein